MLYYPVAVFENKNKTGYGAIIPDLPGCYPVGNTVNEMLADAKEAALFHIEGCIREGIGFNTSPTEIEKTRHLPEYAEAVLWAVIEIDDTMLKTDGFM